MANLNYNHVEKKQLSPIAENEEISPRSKEAKLAAPAQITIALCSERTQAGYRGVGENIPPIDQEVEQRWADQSFTSATRPFGWAA